jgi:hypothetical protein
MLYYPGAGTQTAALGFGGFDPLTGATEEYDGTSWTTSPGSLGNRKIWFSRSRNSSISIRFWWLYCYHHLLTTATEEWTGSGVALTKTITVS